ncbi:MAG: hypothetical protein LBQ41_00635 [Candidatus Ancillula sp.]|jgi:hypothetical protein|nr:hypothetical protein [Candidatus Ancillula sp.]
MGRKVFGMSRVVFVVILIFTAFRFWIGLKQMYYLEPGSTVDDSWVFDQAFLQNRYRGDIGNFQFGVKERGYPLFILATYLTGLPLSFWIVGLWVLCGVLVVFFLKKFCSSQIVLSLSYLFIIFCPFGFYSRLYRNIVLAPSTMILLLSLIGLVFAVFNKKQKTRQIMLWAFFTGAIFSWTYYIKEDGLWQLLLVSSVVALCLSNVILGFVRKKHSKIAPPPPFLIRNLL